MGNSEDLRHKGAYWLGRIHCLHPQIRKGSEIVRRATVAVIGKSTAAADSCPIEYILRDISKIAPVWLCLCCSFFVCVVVFSLLEY